MKLLNIIALTFVSIFVFQACDEISEPYTKGPVLVGDWTSIINTSNVESLIANTKQGILIEDYTGFTCGNCPGAALVAGEIASAYPAQTYVMGVHAGGYAKPTASHTYDFRTEAGTAFDTKYGISKIGNPNGLINRKNFDGSKICSHTSWKEKVESLLGDKPILAFTNLKAKLSADNKSIKVDCELQYMYAQNTSQSLGVYLLEDSIVQYQKDYSKTPSDIPEYVHKHVLRGSINGTWGEAIKNGEKISRGEVLGRSYTYTIPAGKDWRLNKLKVIAFVYDPNKDDEVMQVSEVEVEVE